MIVTMSQQPEIMYIPEVAKLLRISQTTLWTHVRQGTAPPSHKVLGRRVFIKHEVLNWIQQQKENQS